MRLPSMRFPRPPSSSTPVPIGTSGTTPVFLSLNGAPAWKLKLFQKMSLSRMMLSSAGGNFSESSPFGATPSALL